VAFGVSGEGAVDDVGEVALEDAVAGLAGCAAGFGAALEEGAGGGVAAGLGDGDAVDRGVELPVAGPVEPVGVVVAAGGGDRRGAVVPGERGRAAEAADVAYLAEDPGGGDDADAGDREQCRGEGPD
jgi:hypothetical protein